MKTISYITPIGTPVRLKKKFMWSDEEVGDTGIWKGGADYVPGWDAGRWDVALDKPNCYGHVGSAHWTLEEVNRYWEIII